MAQPRFPDSQCGALYAHTGTASLARITTSRPDPRSGSGLPWGRSIDRLQARRPQQIHLLHSPAPPDVTFAWPPGCTVETRSYPSQLPVFVIYDEAVTCMIGTGRAQHLEIITDPSAVGLLAGFFDAVWEAVVSPEPTTPRLNVGEPSAGELDVLQLLAAGLDHAAIARKLEVSVRTVRRRITDIKMKLGAASPFKVGLEAGRRRWL
jgi:Bacterial regulatory proteins, luxR family